MEKLKTTLTAILLLSLITGTGLAESAKKAGETRKILIVTGQDYPGHKWKLTTPVLKKAIEADPRLIVDVTENPSDLGKYTIFNYDSIVFHFMNWQCPAPGKQARENLKKFVSRGKGLVLVHFACGAFQDWPDFVKIAGRVWDPDLRGHDPHGKFTVNVKDPKHPVMKGISDFEITDELYTCLAGNPKIHVVASSISKVDKKEYPMAFTLNYGKGKVFHCVLGHDVKALSTPQAGLIFKRACAWTSGLECDVPQTKNTRERKK